MGRRPGGGGGWLLWVAVLVWMAVSAKGVTGATGVEGRLIDDVIFGGYQKLARPRSNPKDAVNVSLSFVLVSLEGVNERDQTMTVFGGLHLEWDDEFLAWNRSTYNVPGIILPGKHIWRPDIIVRNSANKVYGELTDKDDKFHLTLTSKGHVILHTAGLLTTYCEIDMTYFPFDRQACYIAFESWAYPRALLRLHTPITNISLDHYRESGQWRLCGTKVYSRRQGSPGSSDYVIAIMYLSRKPAYFVCIMMAPCLIMSILVVLVFLLPADAGEKVSLCITLLLTFSVFLLIMAEMMPETSDYIPILEIYLFVAMVLASLSLLCTLFVLNIFHQSAERRVPGWLARLASGRLATLLCVWVPTAPSQPPSRRGSGDVYKFINNKDDPEGLHMRRTRSPGGADGGILRQSPGGADSGDDNDNILSKSGRQGVDKQLAGGATVSWLQVARFCDRVFLIIFLTAVIVIAVVLIGIYPLTSPQHVEPRIYI